MLLPVSVDDNVVACHSAEHPCGASARGLTVDTSIVHIASAFNKPIVSLHANIYREYTKYRPLSEHSRCVRAAKDGAAVGEITLEKVLGEYRSLRDELRSRPRDA